MDAIYVTPKNNLTNSNGQFAELIIDTECLADAITVCVRTGHATIQIYLTADDTYELISAMQAAMFDLGTKSVAAAYAV